MNPSISHWIQQVKHGDSVAADEIWKHYFVRLVRSVRSRLRGGNRAVSDEEDVVLSVFDSGRVRRGGNVQIQSIHACNDDDRVIEIIGNEPSPEMVATIQETAEKFFSVLGVGQLRDLAGAKLGGYSNAELAHRFDCSERTIERRLHLIRKKMQQPMKPAHEFSPTTTTDGNARAD